jgi:hypothetical protein
MKKLFLALSLAAIFTSCEKDDPKPIAGIFKGTETTFQHGRSWTWIEMDGQNKPVRIGIAIDDAAMTSLDTSHPGSGGHTHNNALSLTIPSRSADVPFQHIMLDWNPHGHEPAGLYDKAHFDFHFYLTSEAERKAIPAYQADSSKFLLLPNPAYMPALYVSIPGGVPQMGTHWIDITSGEFGPAGFTQTFIYGSYNGKVNFYEPMITKAFLDANTNFERVIPTPAKFGKSGYYPTKMKVSKAGGVTNVTIEDFVYRTAS